MVKHVIVSNFILIGAAVLDLGPRNMLGFNKCSYPVLIRAILLHKAHIKALA